MGTRSKLQKALEITGILFLLVFFTMFLWNMHFLYSAFQFKKVSDAVIKPRFIVANHAFIGPDVLNLKEEGLIMADSPYSLYFLLTVRSDPLGNTPIKTPGEILFYRESHSPDHIILVHSIRGGSFYLSLYSVAYPQTIVEKFTIETVKLANVVFENNEIICQADNMVDLFSYKLDGKPLGKKCLKAPSLLTYVQTKQASSRVFCFDGKTLATLDGQTICDVENMGDISKSFFIGLDPELYPSMLVLYDGSFIHAFDLSLGIEVCSKEIECFTLETSSKYITGQSKSGIACFNPQTGVLWYLQDNQLLDGQLSKVNIFGQFHNFESSFVLQCEKTIYGLKTSICEINDYGHMRTFSTMLLPCGQVYHCETKGRDFYLFTDRGVFMTDTFEYFELRL